ncbi:hypothetical protein BJV78DRAFT_1206062 [Lactifluus subvellereus]|nr:hypothetical protein BJV78DRAFT_1206062 [Lactifluus subvellereus]
MHIQLPQEDSGSSPFPSYNAIYFQVHINKPFEDSCNLLSHNWDSSDYVLDASCFSSRSSFVSSLLVSPSLYDASIPDLDASTLCLDSEQHYLSYTQQKNRMPTKRRTSLQSILIPPFLSYPIPPLSDTPSETARSPTRVRPPSTSSRPSHRTTPSFTQSPEAASLASSRSSPPPDFLLDDDPFANYTGARPLQPHYGISTSPPRLRKTSVKQPRSPLASEPCPVVSPSPSSASSVPVPYSQSASGSRVSCPSLLASGRQLRPAYTRPAFAPRPSLPSLHVLAQSDFVYPIKARKGTLGARLPLEPWDVSADRDMLLEEAPSLLSPDHATEPLHISGFPHGPESFFGANEDVHTSDSPDVTVDVYKHKETHILDSEASFLQPPISLEPGPEEGSHMFASLFEVLSSFSSSSLSRSPSTSSTSSIPALSPDLRTQCGDSPARSPNRSSSGESAPADLGFDDDVIYSPSEALEPSLRDSQGLEFFSALLPGGFSGADSFQPGTSAGTIRPLVNSIVSDGVSTPSDEDWSSTYEGSATPEFDEADMFDERVENVDETVDGNGQENRNRRSAEGYEEHQTSNGNGSGGQDWRQVNGGDSNGNGWGSASGGSGNGGRDDRREDERNWKASSAFSTPSDTDDEESEEDSTRPLAGRSRSIASEEVSTSEDDNVPLARSIPTALRAQRTIRKQVRDEKDERRRQRALRRQQQPQQRQQIDNQTLLGEERHTQRGPSLPHASSQPVSSSRTTRTRTKTLPSNSSRPIVAEDLARRLRDIQDLNVSSASFLNRHQHSPLDSASHSDQVTQRSEGLARIASVGAQDKSIRPMRSFHRPGTAESMRAQPLPVHLPSHDASRLGRSATTASRPVGRHDQSETSAHVTPGSLSKSSRHLRASEDAHQQLTAPTQSGSQRVSVQHISTDVSDPPPSLPAVSREPKQISWQQRIFIVDLQRFNTVVMNPTTTAREVIGVLETQGQLANWVGAGGWMLFEVSQDFGMERPIRNFEVVSEVINSWDKDKSVNLLVAKKTPLAALLHPSAMPSSSPIFSTYVEWESKPRKWNKRWLQLREQGLWLSKKNNGKDETLLCSLANFDAYVVTRIHKSPKPYVFAVKSTDNFAFFENAADYVHVFCCSEKDGKKWLENILLARSYFINQERNTLSVGVSPVSGGTSAKIPSRSGTRKGSRTAQQPLLHVSAHTTAATIATQSYAFEPGSLLSKR